MIDTIVVSGGNIQEDFALDFLKKTEEKQEKMPYLIAADKGLEFFLHTGMHPDMAVGDFDSLSEAGKEFLKSLRNTEICRLRPEKDDSDTQSAVCRAAERGGKNMVLFGCLGTRLDHTFANMGLLVWGKKNGIRISFYDRHNYITLIESGTVLRKAEQFGKYVSFFSLGGDVPGLTLKGFKYPLNRHYLTVSDCGLTVSNEILEEEAGVTFDRGNLVMIMSRD